MSQAGQAIINGSSGSGTVTSFSFTSTNGFVGTVTNQTTTPNLSLTTNVANNNVMFSNSGDITGDADLTYNSSTNQLNTGIISLPATTSTTGQIKVDGSVVFGVVGFNLYVGGFIGNAAGVTGTGSIAIGSGDGSLENLTSGDDNVGINGLVGVTSGSGNVGINSDDTFISGNNNLIILGGFAYKTSESNNILFLNDGVVGESNTIRIGTQGSSDRQQNRCFIAGISVVTIANPTPVTIDTTTGQLGVGTAGQTQTSAISQGSAVSLTTATPANVTTIALSIGTWSISALAQFGGSPTVTGPQQVSISTASAVHSTLGNNSAQSAWATANFALGNVPVTVPGFVLTVATPTTVFLVSSGVFGAGTMTAYGRITAVKLT